jgi:ammonium transporter, Amt family
VFCDPSLGGPGFVSDWVTGKVISAGDYSIAAQVWTQAKAVGVTLVWSAVVAAIAYSIANVLVGLRVPEEEEREGLDITSHGETAYTA